MDKKKFLKHILSSFFVLFFARYKSEMVNFMFHIDIIFRKFAFLFLLKAGDQSQKISAEFDLSTFKSSRGPNLAVFNQSTENKQQFHS